MHHQLVCTFALVAFALVTVCASSLTAQPPCAHDLKAGEDAAWLAQLKEAREAYRRAAEIQVCRAEALVGLADVERRRGKEDAALEAARAALEATDDERILAEAYFQLGRAVEEQGWKRSEDRQILAEDALRRAIEISDGDHRDAVRALQRLYRETGRDEELDQVQEDNPGVVATTASSRKELVRVGLRKRPRQVPSQKDVGDTQDVEVITAALEEWTPPEDSEAPRFDTLENAQPPNKIEAPQPQFTEEARKARIQGVVIVMALIDEQGLVGTTDVIAGLPMGLTEEAVDAISRWRFEPALDADEEPIAVWYGLTVNYRLQ
ncbi:MAG: energy transducer TonB [Acidobacteriota bacterium]